MGRRRKGPKQREAERLESRAWRLDAVAVRLARARPAIDVALGEIFLRLGVGDRLKELGWSRKKDFAHEALGMPARTFFSIEELALGLRTRPLLKKAVLAGEVTPVKARIVIKGTDESEDAVATAVAMEMTVAGLKKRFKSGEDRPAYTSLRWSMTPEQQDRLDAAIGLAKELEGYDAPEWRLCPAFGRCFAVLRSPRKRGNSARRALQGVRGPPTPSTPLRYIAGYPHTGFAEDRFAACVVWSRTVRCGGRCCTSSIAGGNAPRRDAPRGVPPAGTARPERCGASRRHERAKRAMGAGPHCHTSDGGGRDRRCG